MYHAGKEAKLDDKLTNQFVELAIQTVQNKLDKPEPFAPIKAKILYQDGQPRTYRSLYALRIWFPRQINVWPMIGKKPNVSRYTVEDAAGNKLTFGSKYGLTMNSEWMTIVLYDMPKDQWIALRQIVKAGIVKISAE